MEVRIKISALQQSKWYEYVLRFALGGLATVVTGIIAKEYGPSAGGLFLAFPAIFCASATLVEKHERERKEKAGLRGGWRGKEAAALDAAGAVWGSFGLVCFGGAVWAFAAHYSFACLGLAALIWQAVAVLMWRLRRKMHVTRSSHGPARFE